MGCIFTIITAYAQSQHQAASRLLELLSLVCSARNMRWNGALVEPLILCIPKGEVSTYKQFKGFKHNRDCVSRETSFCNKVVMKSEVLKDTHTYRYTHMQAHTYIHRKERRRKKGQNNPCELLVRCKQVDSISCWKGQRKQASSGSRPQSCVESWGIFNIKRISW